MRDKRPVTIDAVSTPGCQRTTHVRGNDGRVLVQATLTKKEAEALALLCGNANRELIAKKIMRAILEAMEYDEISNYLEPRFTTLMEKWLGIKKDAEKEEKVHTISFGIGRDDA